MVIQHKESYPYSVEFRIGEKVTVSDKMEGGWVWCKNKEGKGAWVPKDYLSKMGHIGTILFDYISTELTVKVGEKPRLIKEESGWTFCANKNGTRGWILTHKLEGYSEQ